MRTKLRSKATLLFVAFAALLLAVAGTAMAITADPSGNTAPAPTIQSDQADYPPGATVTLTGSNWQPGESVHINVNDTYGASWSRNVDVSANANGEITDSFNLPDWFVSDYDVTATGAQSGTARTTFTDSIPQQVTVSPIDRTVTQGSSTTYTVAVRMGGNSNNCTVTLNALGLPPGTTHSFTDNPKTTNDNYQSVLTVNTTAATPANPSGYPLLVQASSQASSCQNNQNIASNPFNLRVNSGDTTAPTSTHTLSPAANANGWNKDNVTVTLNATDNTGGSGVKEIRYTTNGVDPTTSSGTVYTGPFQISSEGTTTLKFRAIDNAGNVENVQSHTVKIDKTAPSITDLGATSNPNANGWYNTNVTNRFKASDSGSGLSAACIANFPAQAGENIQSKTTSGEGSALKVTSDSCTDVAGNTATGVDSATFKVDKTAPSITGSRSPEADANGWNNENVTVSFSCSDALSGVPDGTCPANAVVSSEGANQSRSGTVTDAAGNTASTTVDNIKIDKTNPTITASVSPAPNTNGWNNSDVTVSFSCSDALSGVSGACPDDVVLGEGANQSVTKSVSDQAGNSASVTQNDINVDKTNPTITASVNPAANANGWNNEDVTVSYTCSDALSGVPAGACPANDTVSSEGANQSRSGTVTDRAGNSATATVNNINIDKTAPTVAYKSASPAPNANGWNNTNVTATFEATDLLSGMGATDADKTATDTAVASDEGANVTVSSPAFTDRAGNTAPAGAATSDPFKIDKTAPTINATRSPAANPDGWNNSDVTVHFECSDALSGVNSSGCPADVVLGEGANQSVTRSVSDVAGNSASATQGGINVDKTNPNISASVLNQPDANTGWYNVSTGGPQVHFECSDALSGIQSCPADHTVTDEGPSVTYSDTAHDVAGNSADATAGPFKVDLTAPDVAGAPDLLATSDSGDPDDDLTNDRTPTFNITAEAGSTVDLYAEKGGTETLLGSATATNGVATITSGETLSDGTYNVYAKVTDQAGNVSSTNGINITIVTIDATAPAAPGLDMDASSDTGVSNSDDKTMNDKPKFNGTAEAGSTLKLYDGANLITSFQVGAGGSWTFTLTNALSEGEHQIKATATDAADNTSSESQLTVVIDKTPPVISGADVNDTTWRNTDLSVDFTSSDALSGLKPNQNLGANGSFTLTTSGQSPNSTTPVTASKTVEDVAGNSATRTISALVDMAPPILGIVDNNALSYNVCDTARPVRPTFNPTDTLSGLASSSITWTPSLQPSGVGSYTYKAQAADNATNQAFYPGPTATELKTYSVVYDPNYTDTLGAFSGVLQPVNLTGPRSAFKLGSTMPVKFQLRCGTTPITNAVAKLYLTKIDNVGSAVNEPSATNSPDIGNQFRVTDTTTGQYQFNLSTKAGSQFMGPTGNTVTLGEGTWYMYISLDDGAKFKAAEFDIKK